MKAIQESDMKNLISVFIHHSNKIHFEDKELSSLLLEKENLKISQILVWYKSLTVESEQKDDVILHEAGDESILL